MAINAEEPETARRWIERGVQMIACSSDLGMIRRQSAQLLDAARGSARDALTERLTPPSRAEGEGSGVGPPGQGLPRVRRTSRASASTSNGLCRYEAAPIRAAFSPARPSALTTMIGGGST